MAYKLDLKAFLSAIDNNDYDFLDRQPEDVRQEFSNRALVLLRWASHAHGQHAERYVWLTNEVANKNFLDLPPEIQFRLLAMCGVGRNQRHGWIGMPKRRATSDAVQKFLLQYWPHASDQEIEIIINQFDRDSFTEFVRGTGCEQQEEDKLLAAFDALKAKG